MPAPLPILTVFQSSSELSFSFAPSEAESAGVIRFPLATGGIPTQELFMLAAQAFKVSLDAVTVLYSTVDSALPDLSFLQTKQIYNFSQHMPSDVFYVAHNSIVSQSVQSTFGVVDYETTDSFILNLNLYPYLQLTAVADLIKADLLVKNVWYWLCSALPNKTFIFTGERFSKYNSQKELMYLFVLDLVTAPGVYKLYLDKANLFAHNFMFNAATAYDTLTCVGTLINLPQASSFLCESALSTKQLITLADDSLFVLPQLAAEYARVFTKTADLTIDAKVSGGELGIIFDTRDKRKAPVFKEKYMDVLTQALTRYA